MTGEIIVLVTCPEAESEALSVALVEAKLAACVNIIPGLTSIYRFEEKVCKEPEQLLVIKSQRRLFNRLQERVKELHTYTVPEIVAIPIEDGYQPYIAWMQANLERK